MFDDMLERLNLPASNLPLRQAARQMRWLRLAFAEVAKSVEAELGVKFQMDTVKLGAALLRWVQAMEFERQFNAIDRRVFMDFSASLMLEALVMEAPLSCDERSTAVPAGFWPEGCAYTAFCLKVHDAVIMEEYGVRPQHDGRLDKLDYWWTYRENCFEDARTAAGFFQLLLGYAPSWDFPNKYSALKEPEKLADV